MASPTTANRILAAGRRLLDRRGTAGVTMRRVAEAVGITPMAIYRHYPDRAALLNALADEGFMELAAALNKRSTGGIETRLLGMADTYLGHALENPHLFALMFLERREGARRFPGDFEAGRSPTATVLARAIEEGMRSGHLRQDDAWQITFELGALSAGLIMLFLGGRIEATPSRFRALYKRSFRRYLDGIRT